MSRVSKDLVKRARQEAHKEFDLLWKFGHMTRSEAYAWLASKMQLPGELAHIKQFNREQCDQVKKHVKAYWAVLRFKEMCRLDTKAKQAIYNARQAYPTEPIKDKAPWAIIDREEGSCPSGSDLGTCI